MYNAVNESTRKKNYKDVTIFEKRMIERLGMLFLEHPNLEEKAMNKICEEVSIPIVKQAIGDVFLVKYDTGNCEFGLTFQYILKNIEIDTETYEYYIKKMQTALEEGRLQGLMDTAHWMLENETVTALKFFYKYESILAQFVKMLNVNYHSELQYENK